MRRSHTKTKVHLILARLLLPLSSVREHDQKACTNLIQYNLSIPNLVYSEIRFNPNKWFDPNEIYYIFHIKLPCVFRILCIPNFEHKIESLEYIIV